MVKNAKIDYDEENDVLYLYTGEKAKDSLQIDNFVIDFSSENKIVGIEVMDASKILSELSQTDLSKEALSKIENAGISVYQSRELIYILLVLHLSVRGQKVDVRVPVPAPAAISLPA